MDEYEELEGLMDEEGRGCGGCEGSPVDVDVAEDAKGRAEGGEVVEVLVYEEREVGVEEIF